ncbi:zinc transporter [Cohaesibacter sp. ES.047]|uniref:CorA family divalent cation transporter n=1 Tax=Cohaesibacter sp. ES.047 TaxID=1798205 RepID=UPI000BB69782|nr:CorA family divalent cation transporter [Cohaesibacter sp. ES.047]SNY91920.1 zinc transporter [Cohaesibacter sp. ES.047]
MQLPEPTIPGLIWAFRYNAKTNRWQSLPLDIEMKDLNGDDGFVWLHLGLADTRVGGFLDSIEEFDEEARQELTSRQYRERLSTTQEAVYGTLVDFQRGFDDQGAEIGWLHFVVTNRVIVTTRLKPLRSLDRVRSILAKTTRVRSPLDVFALLVTEFQRTVLDVVVETTETLNDIEDVVYEETAEEETRSLAPARRMIIRLNRHLRTEIALLRRAAAEDEEDLFPGLDDVADDLLARIETVERDVTSLQDRARLLHEEIDAKATTQTNRHLYILSILTAFFMPPTLVTGFFGMNTNNLPLENNSSGTLLAFILIIASAGFAWWLLRKADIL